jgi:hypothetical protein
MGSGKQVESSTFRKEVQVEVRTLNIPGLGWGVWRLESGNGIRVVQSGQALPQGFVPGPSKDT